MNNLFKLLYGTLELRLDYYNGLINQQPNESKYYHKKEELKELMDLVKKYIIIIEDN